MNLEWMDSAACKGMDTELFFEPNYGPGRHPMQSVCDGCPVRQQCLDYANAVDYRGARYGFFGGQTAGKRRSIAAEPQGDDGKWASTWRARYDEVAIERAVGGDYARLNRTELQEAMRRLLRRGHSVAEMAMILRVTDKTIERNLPQARSALNGEGAK